MTEFAAELARTCRRREFAAGRDIAGGEVFYQKMPAGIRKGAERNKIEHSIRCDAQPVDASVVAKWARERAPTLRKRCHGVVRGLRGRIRVSLLIARACDAPVVRRAEQILHRQIDRPRPDPDPPISNRARLSTNAP